MQLDTINLELKTTGRVSPKYMKLTLQNCVDTKIDYYMNSAILLECAYKVLNSHIKEGQETSFPRIASFRLLS